MQAPSNLVASLHRKWACKTEYHLSVVDYSVRERLQKLPEAQSQGLHRGSRRKSSSLKAARAQAVDVTQKLDTETAKLVQELKGKLTSENPDLPTGTNGRDDEELLFWFLKDRKLDVDAAATKLVKTLKWRQEFGVVGLTDDNVAQEAATGKAYLHDKADIKGRPVVVVAAAKHFPDAERLVASQQLCVFLIERALARLPPGEEQMLGIFDLRGFKSKNGDLAFVKFLIDAFFNYYPKRLGQVLFVDAPFIFQPGWTMMKPLLKSYASLVRFCTVEEVAEYFSAENLPEAFRT
eukprot:jgi/Mesen1/7158/ME000037S06519